MDEVRYVLYAAMYGLEGEAAIELPLVLALREGGAGIAGVGLLHVDGPGHARLAQPGGGTLSYSVGLGAAVGVVVGLWLPSQLATMALGAAVGLGVGRRLRAQEAGALASLFSDLIPPGALAITAVVDERVVGTLNGQLGLALRTSVRAITPGSVLDLARAMARNDQVISEALAEQAQVEAARLRERPDQW